MYGDVFHDVLTCHGVTVFVYGVVFRDALKRHRSTTYVYGVVFHEALTSMPLYLRGCVPCRIDTLLNNVACMRQGTMADVSARNACLR